MSVEATIEYAVQALQIQNIVVCGHAGCGAVGGFLNQASLKDLPAVESWVQHMNPILDGVDGELPVDEAIKLNVKLQLSNLLSYSYVADAVAQNKLELQGCVYDFAAGSVDFLN